MKGEGYEHSSLCLFEVEKKSNPLPFCPFSLTQAYNLVLPGLLGLSSIKGESCKFSFPPPIASLQFTNSSCTKRFQARFKYDISRSISHIVKQARFKCNIPRSISHKPKQARLKCNIPRSISHKAQEERSKCDIPRSISLNPDKRAPNVTFLVL